MYEARRITIKTVICHLLSGIGSLQTNQLQKQMELTNCNGRILRSTKQLVGPNDHDTTVAQAFMRLASIIFAYWPWLGEDQGQR